MVQEARKEREEKEIQINTTLEEKVAKEKVSSFKNMKSLVM